MNGINMNDLIIKLSNIAIRVEGKGQYNLAKYIRATMDALVRSAAFKLGYETNSGQLSADLSEIIEALALQHFDNGVIEKLKLGSQLFSDSELARIADFPEPTVCRRCGFITTVADKPKGGCCKVCGADIDTFVTHYPIYWMKQFDPFESVHFLKQTPIRYTALLEGIPAAQTEKKPADGGWSILEVIKHIKDANGVLNARVKLILAEDNPLLEFKKVWAWADNPSTVKDTVESVLGEYKTVRKETVEILENISLKDWWRPAVHEEFGAVTLKEQVSYFAAHELSHIRQVVEFKRISY